MDTIIKAKDSQFPLNESNRNNAVLVLDDKKFHYNSSLINVGPIYNNPNTLLINDKRTIFQITKFYNSLFFHDPNVVLVDHCVKDLFENNKSKQEFSNYYLVNTNKQHKLTFQLLLFSTAKDVTKNTQKKIIKNDITSDTNSCPVDNNQSTNCSNKTIHQNNNDLSTNSHLHQTTSMMVNKEKSK
jgi:hypothetical protein